MTTRRTLALLAAAPLALILASCVENAADGDAIKVTANADTCKVSADHAESGARTFSVTNDGEQVTEAPEPCDLLDQLVLVPEHGAGVHVHTPGLPERVHGEVRPRCRGERGLEDPGVTELPGVAVPGVHQPAAPAQRIRGAVQPVRHTDGRDHDRRHAALAQAALQVDLLGIHEVLLVEPADGADLRHRQEQHGAHHPVDRHGRGGPGRRDVVPHGLVEHVQVTEAGQRSQPLDGLVQDRGEVPPGPLRRAVLVDDLRADHGRLIRGGRRHQSVDLRPRDLGVRVEDQGQLGGDRGQAGVHVRPEPAVALAAHHGESWIVRLGVRGGRGVVRDHDGGQRVSGIAQQAVDEGEGGGRIAVVRDHHGHRRRGRLGCHAGSSLSSDGRRTQRPRTCVEYREALAKTRASRWGGAMAARTALSTLTGQPRDGKGEPCPAPRGRTKP